MKYHNFINQTKGELLKVNWPSKAETIKLVVAVVLFIIFISIVLGSFDMLFDWLRKLIIER